MDENTVRFSDAVAKLLSEENKNKSLGEASEELNEYIIIIKELVDSGEINYQDLQTEIAKHLTSEDKTIPGSLAQLLVGCVGENGACPMKQENIMDVPFAYDNKMKKIIPLSSQNTPYNKETYAVLYFTGEPSNLDIKSLHSIEEAGFRKLKIEYKSVNSANYKTLYVENLSKFIYSQPEKGDDNMLYLLGLIFILIIFYFLVRK